MRDGPAASERPLRVGIVLTSSAGGIGRPVSGLARELRRRGHAVLVWCPPATAAVHGLTGTLPLIRLPAARSADVVHAHGYKAGALAAAALRPGGPPLVVTWHNEVLGRSPAALGGRLLQRFVARAADLTLGASSDLVERARRCGARRVRLGPVAAPPLAPPTRHPSEVRRDLDLPVEAFVVLIVARLAPQKNLALLLDVAAELRRGVGDARVIFLVAGEGPERAALKARIDAERLPVRLLGHRNDVADLLRTADAVLLTSAWEARALVAQEALRAGTPLVSTRVGGIAELVGDAADLVDPGDASAAAVALHALYADPALRDRRRRDGLDRAATWPDEAAVAADVEAAYRTVTEPGPPVAGRRICGGAR